MPGPTAVRALVHEHVVHCLVPRSTPIKSDLKIRSNEGRERVKAREERVFGLGLGVGLGSRVELGLG